MLCQAITLTGWPAWDETRRVRELPESCITLPSIGPQNQATSHPHGHRHTLFLIADFKRSQRSCTPFVTFLHHNRAGGCSELIKICRTPQLTYMRSVPGSPEGRGGRSSTRPQEHARGPDTERRGPAEGPAGAAPQRCPFGQPAQHRDGCHRREAEAAGRQGHR